MAAWGGYLTGARIHISNESPMTSAYKTLIQNLNSINVKKNNFTHQKATQTFLQKHLECDSMY